LTLWSDLGTEFGVDAAMCVLTVFTDTTVRCDLRPDRLSEVPSTRSSPG